MCDLQNELIEKLIKEQNGIIKTAEVLALGVTKDEFYRYVEAAGLEKAAHGIYTSPDMLQDEMYLLQAQYPKAIYSHEAALFLHGLAEKEPLPFTVTVQSGHNASALKKKGVKVYYAKKEWYELGITEISSLGGHTVKVYDMERTICDIIRKRSEMDIAVFNYALKEYAKRKDKDTAKLNRYAKAMRLERKIDIIMGVLF